MLPSNHAIRGGSFLMQRLVQSRFSPALARPLRCRFRSSRGSKSTTERFLVTGGQGLLGGWIIRELLKQRPHADVLSLDVHMNDQLVNQILQPHQKSMYNRVSGDVSDFALVEDVVMSFQPNTLIHCAALQIPSCRTDPLHGAKVNVQGTLNVFEALRKLKEQGIVYINPIVYASSAAVHGANKGPTPDTPIPDTACNTPTTHYGVYKTANEGSADIYWRDHGIKSVGLRPHTVFGVGREVGITSGPSLALKALAQNKCTVHDPFEITFTGKTSFNWVGDLARIFVQCSQSESRLDRMGVGALALNIKGQVLDVEEYIKVIETLSPANVGKVRANGPNLPVAYAFDEKGLEQLLGEWPVRLTPLREAMQDTFDRYEALVARGSL